VVREFGTEILDRDGAIDRRKLAAGVFDYPERLRWLNGIVHPLVIGLEEKLIAEAEARDPHGIAVVEAAILVETGSYTRFEKMVLAVCGDEEQIVRAMRRDKMTREEAMARLRRQMPLEEKRKYADYVVDTSGSKENTARQTRLIFDELRSLNQP
jgi:dephospho-CoA kinase